MNSEKDFETLMTEYWPNLRERAQNERDPQKLIALLEEIDDLLLDLELRVAELDENRLSRSGLEIVEGEQEIVSP